MEGPAAYDILTNFEQRWRKVSKWRDFKVRKVSPWQDDALIKLDRVPSIACPSLGSDGDSVVHVREEKDPENWHVQVGKIMFHKMTSILSAYHGEIMSFLFLVGFPVH